jgi:hypothetical protein
MKTAKQPIPSISEAIDTAAMHLVHSGALDAPEATQLAVQTLHSEFGRLLTEHECEMALLKHDPNN